MIYVEPPGTPVVFHISVECTEFKVHVTVLAYVFVESALEGGNAGQVVPDDKGFVYNRV